MGGQGAGPSAYEIAAMQEKAQKAEEKRLAEEKASKTAEANKTATGGESTGGEALPYDDGALSYKKKKGSTLAGEGAQTFGANGNLGS